MVLQAGDTLEMIPSAEPKCAEKSGTATATDLPLSSSPVGSLIARLDPQSGSIFPVGKATKLNVQEASHLFLGWNVSKAPACDGTISVKVQKTPSTSADAGASPNRKEQLKSQLMNAAQVFMSGQFGMGKTESGGSNVASTATSPDSVASPQPGALKVSET